MTEGERNQYEWLEEYGFVEGQKVMDTKDERVLTVKGMGTYLDQYDVLLVEEFDGFILPSDVRTIDYYMSLIADLCGEDSDVIYFLKHGQKTPKIIPYGKSETEEQFVNMMAMALLIGDEKGEFTDKVFGYHNGVWYHALEQEGTCKDCGGGIRNDLPENVHIVASRNQIKIALPVLFDGLGSLEDEFDNETLNSFMDALEKALFNYQNEKEYDERYGTRITPMDTRIIGCIANNKNGFPVPLYCTDCQCTERDKFDSNGCAENRFNTNSTLIFDFIDNQNTKDIRDSDDEMRECDNCGKLKPLGCWPSDRRMFICADCGGIK